VVTALRMAVVTDKVSVDVVDGLANMEMVQALGVSGVPTVIVNDRLSTEGSVPDESLLELVIHATDPSRPPPGITSVPFRSCGRLDVD
jgi:predicted DsbA family dithiol-disulfide isomerase